MRSREIELPRAADSGNCGCNCRGIDAGRLVTRESEQNCAVRRVADASESQRSVELGLDARHMIEQASAAKLTRKEACRAHRAHGVRTGRANADFVQVEQTRGHG